MIIINWHAKPLDHIVNLINIVNFTPEFISKIYDLSVSVNKLLCGRL